MNLFYASPSDILENSVTIHGQEAKHISKVLRFGEGDTIQITDGAGTLYNCIIERVHKERLTAIIERSEKEMRKLPHVTLCLGIIKKRDRLEFAVEKSVELGADAILLFSADNSEREKVRLDRVEGIVLSAMKQSKGLWLPEVYLANSLKDVVQKAGDDTTIVTADEQLNMTIDPEKIPDSRKYFLIVGPEGGFSKRERDFLNSMQSTRYSLGERRLRAETAAIVMVDRFKQLG
ncbi:MAG: 16S rRNA (uracil(1498)-N(3))-methyltransferase [Balneolaceae bacterium]|nr:MAG: 16S rRNA (uracil(1498)-N(3))-methyltransferase [Balneolaceae bacterium]